MSLKAPSLAAVSVLVILMGGCARREVAADTTAPAPPPVNVVRAVRADVAKDVELSGEFRSYQEIDLHAKVAGYLRQITVDVGDRVKEGQVIGVLEVPELAEEHAQAAASERRSQVEVGRAESEVTRAESVLKLRQISYERIASVAKTRPNLVAQQEIDDAAAKFEEAKAQLAAAKAALSSTEEQVKVSGAGRARVETMLRYLKITAPFSGVIIKRYADTGAMIQAGTASQTQAMPVVRLAQVDRLRLVLPVPESIVSRVHPGTPVEIRVDALGRVVQGKVARFTNELASGTRTMSTQVDVPNPGGDLKPGMFAYAVLSVERRAGVLTVPVQSVAREGETDTAALWVVAGDHTIERRKVSTGLESPERLEIRSGLNEGDMVVLGSAGQLRAGQKVTPRLVADAEGGR